MPTSASPNARLHRLAAYLRRQGRLSLAADLSAAVRDAEAMRRLRADHLSPAEVTAAMRQPIPAADPAPTDPARLWCGRCDRAVTPDEIEEDSTANGSVPWWFHTCGDAVGLKGRRPDGTDFRSYVASLADDPAPAGPLFGSWQQCTDPGCRTPGPHAHPPAADPAPTGDQS